MTTHDDDDLPNVSGETRPEANNFRGRESVEEAPDEGMPSVNRNKKGNKVVSSLIIICVAIFGLLLIIKVNSSPKAKKVDTGNAMVTNNLPPIDTTPPPPAGPVNAAPPINTPAPARATASTGNADVYHPPEKGANGKLIVHWSDRKMIGDLVVKSQGQPQQERTQQPGGRVPDYAEAGQATAAESSSGSGGLGGSRGSPDSLGARLTGTPTPSVMATLLRNRDFLLTKGTSLDCSMDTAIDTSLPGIISCTLNNDVYSDNNRTLLMEKGTQMIGEQQGNVKQGQARVFALWTRAKTPNGVVINLNSPGADGLGRSGLDGWVDNHFSERFGAAILVTFIQSSLKYAIASQSSNSPTTVIGDTADSGEGVVSKILDSTINIPPTILKNQGDHINIMLARDLDFSSVYQLQAN